METPRVAQLPGLAAVVEDDDEFRVSAAAAAAAAAKAKAKANRRVGFVVVNIDESEVSVKSSSTGSSLAEASLAEASLPWDFTSPASSRSDDASPEGSEPSGDQLEKYAQRWRISAEVAACGSGTGLRAHTQASSAQPAQAATADDSVAESLDVEVSVMAHSHRYSEMRRSELGSFSGFEREPSEMRGSGDKFGRRLARDRNSQSSSQSSSGNSMSSVSSATLSKALAMHQTALEEATSVAKRLEAPAEDEPLLALSRSSMDSRARRQRFLSMVVLWALPTACCVWYAAAIFFPIEATAAAPALLWTPGASVWVNGTVSCCPKPALCSEGWAQFWLLVAARLSAFAMYPSLLLVFLSKCHAALRFLSRTFVAELLPLSHLHDMHTFHGLVFASLALLHTVVHLVRWGLRGEIRPFLGRWTGTSGAIGMALMLAVTGSMLMPRLLRCPKRLSRLAALGNAPFELRFNIHYCFILLAVALCIHSSRLLILTLVAVCAWMSDYVYQVICRTFRLDVVEFTRLEDGGVQVLWSNPKGFGICHRGLELRTLSRQV